MWPEFPPSRDDRPRRDDERRDEEAADQESEWQQAERADRDRIRKWCFVTVYTIGFCLAIWWLLVYLAR
jgi:hypothetical protein